MAKNIVDESAHAHATPETDTFWVPFTRIRVNPDLNYRLELPEIKAMAASLTEHGQQEAVGVEPTGDPDEPYLLVKGYRRHGAMRLLGWTHKNRVLVTLKPRKRTGNGLARVVRNVISNQHVAPSVVERARLAEQLVRGTYPVLEGETAEPVEKAEVARLLQVTEKTLHKLLRIVEGIDPQVLAKAAEWGMPKRELCAISALRDTALQNARLLQWRADQEALEDALDARKAARALDDARHSADLLAHAAEQAGKGKTKALKEKETDETGAPVRKSTLGVRGTDMHGRTARSLLACLEWMLTDGPKKFLEKKADRDALQAKLHAVRYFLALTNAREPLVPAVAYKAFERDAAKKAEAEAEAKAKAKADAAANGGAPLASAGDVPAGKLTRGSVLAGKPAASDEEDE